ncbi:MAG: hypothetical protein ACREJQ_00715 [bacterium]
MAAPRKRLIDREQFDTAFVNRSLRMTVALWLGFSALAFLSQRWSVGWGFALGGLFNVIDILSLMFLVTVIGQKKPSGSRLISNLLTVAAVVFTILKYPAFFAILYFGLRQPHLMFINPYAFMGFLLLFQAVVFLKILSIILLSWAGK